jgi:hypothetical protein
MAILKEGIVDEDEDEFFVTEELGDTTKVSFSYAYLKTDNSDFQKIEKDGLVSKLLETKKDLEGYKDKQSNSEDADSKKTISPHEVCTFYNCPD